MNHHMHASLTQPRGKADIKALLRQHLSNTHYREVIKLTKFVLDDARFGIAPASVSSPERPAKHHGEGGGLARHTWEVLSFALATAKAFPGYVDLVALAVGAIVHDCGKMREYAPNFVDGVEHWRRATPLVSHIMHGLQGWALFSQGQCSQALQDQVSHLIASHHGRREWGSPVVPSTLEAFILHSSDIQSLMLNGVDNPAFRP